MSLRDKIKATLSKCRSLQEMIDVLKVATGNGDDTEMMHGFDRNALIDAALKKNAHDATFRPWTTKLLAPAQLEQMSNIELMCAAGKYADLSEEEQQELESVFYEEQDKLSAKYRYRAQDMELVRLAKRGNTTAAYELFIRAYGDQAEHRKLGEDAYKWLLKAAESGNVIAQRRLGEEYRERGKTDVAFPLKDGLLQAAKWLKAAAEQGDIMAEQEFNEVQSSLATYPDVFSEQIIGKIPSKIAEAVPRMIAAPIIIDRKGAEHIQEKHPKELEQRGVTPAEFVERVVENFNCIYDDKGHPNCFQLVCKNATDPSERVIVGVQLEGNSYRVVTATPIRERDLKKAKLLWDGTPTSHHAGSQGKAPADVDSDKATSEENINNSEPDVNSENEKNFEKLKKAAEANPFIANHINDIAKAHERKEEAFKFGPLSEQWKEWEELNARLWAGREDEFYGQYCINKAGGRGLCKTTIIGKGDAPGTLKAIEVSTAFQWRQTYDRIKKEFKWFDYIGEKDKETDTDCSLFLEKMWEYLLDKTNLDALFEKEYNEKIKECHVLESVRYA